MTTITIPRETFDAMREALENIAGDKWPDPEMTAEEYAREALSAAKAVSDMGIPITEPFVVGGPHVREKMLNDILPKFLYSPVSEVQPQAQGETDYYADARTWYEWSTQTNWHSPKWDDFSPLGLARVQKEYQDALAVEKAWRLLRRESPRWANDARSRNIFASGFYAGSKHPQASEPAWRDIETAPKSEEVLLFATKNRPHAFIGYWGEYNRYNKPRITHWMPLPAAPEATK